MKGKNTLTIENVTTIKRLLNTIVGISYSRAMTLCNHVLLEFMDSYEL